MHSYLRYKIILVLALSIFVAGCAAQAPYLKPDPSLKKDVRVFNDTTYVPLVRVCDVYGIDCKWDSYIKTAVLIKNGRIILRAGSDKVIVNDSEKKLSSPVVFTNSTVYIPESFVRSGLA